MLLGLLENIELCQTDNLKIQNSKNKFKIKSSWSIISTSSLDKEALNLALEDTSIYFPRIPVLENV